MMEERIEAMVIPPRVAKCKKSYRSRARTSEMCCFIGHPPSNTLKCSAEASQSCWEIFVEPPAEFCSNLSPNRALELPSSVLTLSRRAEPPASGISGFTQVYISGGQSFSNKWFQQNFEGGFTACQLLTLCSRYEAGMNDSMLQILPYQ